MATTSKNDELWLHKYLVDTVRQNMCTRANCTTCAAGPFRYGLLNALGKYDLGNVFEYTHEDIISIAQGLVHVRPVEEFDKYKFDEAVRLVILIIWYAVEKIEHRMEIESIIEGSFAGQVLEGMKSHNNALQKTREACARNQAPEMVKIRQVDKKRMRQEKHAARLALKAERDRELLEYYKNKIQGTRH